MRTLDISPMFSLCGIGSSRVLVAEIGLSAFVKPAGK